jgi:hypothetical protein
LVSAALGQPVSAERRPESENPFREHSNGYRVVVPMSAGNGERGDYIVVDDPQSVDQAESDLERPTTDEWWNGSMSTCLNDFASGHKVVIQQRLHEADLTGDLPQKGGYELLYLPAEFEPEGLKTTLGSYRDAGQYQQRPSRSEGVLFKASLVSILAPCTPRIASRAGERRSPLASRPKRSIRPRSRAIAGGRTFSATLRSSRVSVAR